MLCLKTIYRPRREKMREVAESTCEQFEKGKGGGRDPAIDCEHLS